MSFSAHFIDISSTDGTASNTKELEELALHAFTLAEQYPPNTSGISPNIPLGIRAHRFAVVFYHCGAENKELSLIKVILHQNPPSHPARVVVDFQTRTAVCEDQEATLAIEPEQIERVQEELKLWVRDVRQSTRMAPLPESRVATDWTEFLQRLESRGMLPAKSYSGSSIQKPCPLCDVRTACCNLCHTTMCLNRECAVSQLTPFRSCSQHVSRAICLPCLENAGETLFSQCPKCELWFCTSDLTWCLGRPKDLSHISRDTNPHNIPNSDREHPAKPMRCSSCVGGQVPPRCGNGNCWSVSRRVHTIICDSCLPDGLWCACERYWVCSACRTSPLYNYLKDCPRCGRTYCPHFCHYIGFCANCGHTTVCDDCFEEDWSRFAGPTVGDKVILPGRCDEFDCQKRICSECLEGARCVGCDRTVCISCTPQSKGDRSDGYRCFLCTPGLKSIFPEDTVVLSMTFE